jgi:uncharacterized protein (PEP-CTERM system associated)
VKVVNGITILSLIFICTESWANELDYQLSFNTEAISQSVKDTEDGNRLDFKNFVITPSLSLLYTSKRLDGFWRANHQHVYRSVRDISTTQDFTNYNYGIDVSLVEKFLNFRINGALSNRSPSLNDFQTDDILLNSDNLSKTRRNNSSLNLNIPTGEYLGLTSILSYSDSKSERTETGFTGLENNVYSLSSNLVTGTNFQRIYGLLNTNVSLQKRPQGNGDVLSRQAQAELSLNLIDDFGLTLTATNEGNQVSSDNNVFSLSRNFSTYGAGLSWRKGIDRFITITLNKTEGNQLGQESQDDQTFVGLNTAWQFTPRTTLSARYGRRVFGESGEFSLSHSIKRLRTQLRYSEEITSFSRLESDPSSLGVFVCADGIRDLSACFQPSSLNYNLAPNEEFVQFSDQNTEISDDLILRQALSWQIGISKRRTRLSFNGRYSLNEYLESDRINRTYSAGIALGFQVGAKTDLSFSSQYAVSNNQFEGSRAESNSLTSILSVSRSIGRYFNVSLNARYLERKIADVFAIGSGQNLDGIDEDLKDRRITLRLSYQYGSR